MKRIIIAILMVLATMLCLDCVAETYVIAVGINRYKSAATLRVSEKDAKDFAALVRQFPGTHVTTVTGRYATRANLGAIIGRECAKAKADDAIILYFSGHGNEGGICAYDSPSGLTKDLLQYKQIAGLMKKSPARRKLIIVDSCHAGSSRSTSRGKQKHTVSDPNVVLFMSSRANEFSLEAPGTGNSIFTGYLLSGLKGSADADKDRRITARELFDYVSRGVIKSSSGRQHPVMWGNFDKNFVISTY